MDESFRKLLMKTVGYTETKDKVSFMSGASVAFYLLSTKPNLEKEIADLKRRVDEVTASRDAVESDLETLARIINKYLPINEETKEA